MGVTQTPVLLEDPPPAGPSIGVRIEIQPVEKSAADDPHWHVFGGRRCEITYRLMGESETPIDLRAHVSQLTFSPRAPADRSISILDGVATSDLPGPRVFAIEFPVVERESTFEIRFDGRRSPTGTWIPIEATRVQVYPADRLSALRPWSDRVQLRIRDSREVLVPTLARLEVAYLDARAPLIDKNSPAVTLVVDPVIDQDINDWTMRDGETVIFFHESESRLPAIVIDRGGSTVIRVGLPVLSELESDPRSQKLFLEILKLAVN
jgi:hypothetical protein